MPGHRSKCGRVRGLAGQDRLWYGTANGFTAVPVSVTRQYTPVTGDFDGNGTMDVLWYGPGAARDYLWRGTWARSFIGVSVKVNGTYSPVVGDFGRDGPEDIYWHGQAGGGVVWRGRRGGGFEGASGGRRRRRCSRGGGLRR